MIVYLTEWLKKLILLVLLAAITDLLLPNTNMQKYARMVIGLLIILTMLSPILAIFHLDKFGDAIALNSQIMNFSKEGNKDFAEIERKANELKKVNQQEIVNHFVQTFKKEIAVQIASTYEVEAEVEVSLHINKDSEAIIDKIMVYLLGRVHKKDNKDNPYNSSDSIESIPAIEIKIGEENADEAKSDLTLAMNGTGKAIQTFLTSNYHLTDEQVEIVLK